MSPLDDLARVLWPWLVVAFGLYVARAFALAWRDERRERRDAERYQRAVSARGALARAHQRVVTPPR